MTNEKTPLVFFGSGPVAAESLRLLSNTFSIEAIITKPTTEQEMGSVCSNTPVFTVTNKYDLDKLIDSSNFSSAVAVLIDFGIIVSQKVIDYFPKGIINSHFSLLPEWRGADPITFSILSGQAQTGVSLMMLVEAMDEGPLLAQSTYDIETSETTPSLTEALIELSYQSLDTILPLWLKNKVEPAPQESVSIAQNKTPTYSRKLTKEDGALDWNKSATQLEREIRAFVGWPKSRTKLGDIECAITKSYVINKTGTAGEIFIDGKILGVYCGADALFLESIKPAGKNEMDSASFINGYKDRLNI